MNRDPLNLLVYLVVLIIVVFLVIYAINALAPATAAIRTFEPSHFKFRIG